MQNLHKMKTHEFSCCWHGDSMFVMLTYSANIDFFDPCYCFSFYHFLISYTFSDLGMNETEIK